MTERVEPALAALRAKLAELESVVRDASEAGWRRVAAAEGWPVGLVAFHIARGLQRQAEFVEDARHSHAPHIFNWGDTHALNAAVAAAHPSPERDETIALAQSSVERIASALQAMDELALARAAFINDGRERDAVWIAGRLATEHARGHLESIVVTLRAGGPGQPKNGS